MYRFLCTTRTVHQQLGPGGQGQVGTSDKDRKWPTRGAATGETETRDRANNKKRDAFIGTWRRSKRERRGERAAGCCRSRNSRSEAGEKCDVLPSSSFLVQSAPGYCMQGRESKLSYQTEKENGCARERERRPTRDAPGLGSHTYSIYRRIGTQLRTAHQLCDVVLSPPRLPRGSRDRPRAADARASRLPRIVRLIHYTTMVCTTDMLQTAHVYRAQFSNSCSSSFCCYEFYFYKCTGAILSVIINKHLCAAI